MFVILRDTGMRRSELANMKIDDLHLDDGRISLPLTKNGDSRQVPMSPDMRASLARYLRRRDRQAFAHLPDVWIGKRGASPPTESVRSSRMRPSEQV